MRCENPQISRWRSLNCKLGRISGIHSISITGNPTKYSGKPSDVSAAKHLTLLDKYCYIKDKCCPTQQWGGHPLQLDKVFKRPFEPNHSHTIGPKRGKSWRGKYHHYSWSLPRCYSNGLGRLQVAMKFDLKCSKSWINKEFRKTERMANWGDHPRTQEWRQERML